MKRLAICLLGLVACDARDRGPTRRAAGATAPRDGGTLRFSTKDAVRTLDPARAGDEVSLYVVHPLFDTLLAYAPGSVRLEPRLARRWELAPDGLTYHFWLRDGIRYGDGRAIVAADFAYALDRALAIQDSVASTFLTSVAGAGDVIAGKATHCAGVTAVGERELEVRLASPNAAFHYAFAMAFTAPQRADHVAGAGDQLRRRPLATGPYRLRDWDEGRRVVLERNPYYDDPGRQHLDEIVMLENVPRDVQLLMFERGELDAAERLSAPDQLWLLEQPAWQPYIHRRAQLVAYGMRMNVRVPPFDDVRVRRALSYATPYDEILKQVYRGFAGRAHGPVSDHDPGFDPYFRPYAHDPERARRLLHEAGHSSGFKTTMAYSTAEPLGEPVGVQLRSAFKDVGVTLELEPMPPSTYTDALFNGRRPMFFQSFGADSPDPAYVLGVFYQSKSSNNWGGYKSARTDACLAKAGRPQLTWDQRIQAHKRCARTIASDAPWIWFAQPGFQVSTHRGVTGINWYAGEGVDWSKVDYAG
jgi:oligopeptide transport system substrate-binding protein